MPSDQTRRNLATATLGAGGLAAGGYGRHLAVKDLPGKAPRVHLTGVLRRGSKGNKKLYLASSALGLASAAPFSVGVARMVQGDEVEKKDDKRPSFFAEGLRGSGEALRGRGESAMQPVPKGVRATQLGIAAAAGFGGGAAARGLLKGKAKGLRPIVGPVAGTLAATASLPLTNHVVQRKHPEYKVTAYGVKRDKTAPKKPSSASFRARPETRSFRADVGKSFLAGKAIPVTRLAPGARQSLGIDIGAQRRARLAGRNVPPSAKGREIHPGVVMPKRNPVRTSERLRSDPRRNGAEEGRADALIGRSDYPVKNKEFGEGYRYVQEQIKRSRESRGRVGKADSYLGSRTGYNAQRAAITLAGHPPIIGPFTAAAAAGKYAPPGQERKQALRQYGMGSAAPVAVGVGGAYAGAHLADKSKRAESLARSAVDLKDAIHNKARKVVGMGPKVANPNSRGEKIKGKFLASGPGKKLLGPHPERWGARGVGATAGFLGAKMAAAGVLGQTAITMNQHDQKRYNAKHGINKAAPTTGTVKERRSLADQKRLNAALAITSGSLGLGSLGLLAAKKKAAATSLGIIASGVGGTNSLIGARVQNKEAKQVDVAKKRKTFSEDELEYMSQDDHIDIKNHYGAIDYNDKKWALQRRGMLKQRVTHYRKHGLHDMADDIDEALGDVDAHFKMGAYAPKRAPDTHANRMVALKAKNKVLADRAKKKETDRDDSAKAFTERLRRNASKSRQDPRKNKARYVTKRDFSKAAWKNFYPAPPGVKRIPRHALVHTSEPIGSQADNPIGHVAELKTKRGQPVARLTHYGADNGWLKEGSKTDFRRARNGPATIGSVSTEPGFRRRGIATDLLNRESARIGKPIGHSSNRSHDGDAWAKATGKKTGSDVPTNHGSGSYGKNPTARYRRAVVSEKVSTSRYGAPVQRNPNRVSKRSYAEPLKTSITEDDAKDLVGRHGLTGPLPKTLDREQRRAAYEARYVTAGGHKANKWQHRALVADKVKNIGLAGATAGGAVWVGARTAPGTRLARAALKRTPILRKVNPAKVQRHAETTAGAAAVAGGGGELYANHARRKRSSYASAPSGVAASALRRLQAYDRESS